jgi:prophage regulatory protein
MLVETHTLPEGVTTAAAPALERLIGRKETLLLIGISNATLWRWIKAGRFPAPVKIGKKKVAWRSSVLANWIAQRTSVA